MNMDLISKRDLHKRIVAVVDPQGGYKIKHDIPGEAIICNVPTLEIAGCIVKALRERQISRIALHILAVKHTTKRRKIK